jgi:methylmalonyl-CoA mutase
MADTLPPGLEDWRQLVAKALKGRDPATLTARTRDGILIEPLYPRREDGRPLPTRGARPWTIVQPVDDPDPDRANTEAYADLKGGATGLSLRFAGAPAAGGSGVPATEEALAAALDLIDLTRVALRIEPHAGNLQSADWAAALAARSATAPELTKIAFGLDPVAALGADAKSAAPDPTAFAACFGRLKAARFRGPLATLDARPYHEAGASEAQELAGILAAAAWWLRALSDAGVAPADTLPLLGAAIAVDRDVLLSIAKLRALRMLWARIAELCDVPSAALAVHAETSRRMLTRADVSTNLLRNTIACFAAAVAGADSIGVLPHTSAAGLADRGARILAMNVQHLLAEESQIWHVADPAAGSGALETLTDGLCERAWAEFHAIEREGGIVESLRAGAFQTRIAKARAALVNAVSTGATPLVGATIHPPSDEAPMAFDPAAQPTGLPDLAPISLEAFAKVAA